MNNIEAVISRFAQLSKETVGRKDIENRMQEVMNKLAPLIRDCVVREVETKTIVENIKTAFADGGYEEPSKKMIDEALRKAKGDEAKPRKSSQKKAGKKPVPVKPTGATQPNAPTQPSFNLNR